MSGLGGGGASGPFLNLPAFCRVAATLKPTSDSDIKIESLAACVRLERKFQAVGNGGWAGSIGYAAMAQALRRGYATSATDDGNPGPAGSGRLCLNTPSG